MNKTINFCICLVLFGCFVLVLDSCTYEKEELPEPLGPQCDTTNLTWADSVQHIVTTYCSDPGLGSCHQSGSFFGDYSTYAGLKAKVDNGSFKTRVLDNKDMPPTSSPKPLPDCDRLKLEAWFNRGAPQ